MTSLASTGRALALGLAALFVSPVVWAEIVIGQTSGFTGPVASGVKENTATRLFVRPLEVTSHSKGGRHGNHGARPARPAGDSPYRAPVFAALASYR